MEINHKGYITLVSPYINGGILRCLILRYILVIGIWKISADTTLKWILQVFTDDKSSLF